MIFIPAKKLCASVRILRNRIIENDGIRHTTLWRRRRQQSASVTIRRNNRRVRPVRRVRRMAAGNRQSEFCIFYIIPYYL